MQKTIKYILLIIAVVLPSVMVSQTTYSSKDALEIFKNGDYTEAQKAYDYLLKKFDREPKYNYYYGICLIQNNQNLSEAVKRLKFAAIKGVSRDAYYYLGRAYQLTYNFNEAIVQYERFLKYASESDIRNDKAEKYIKQCETGRQFSSKVYDLTVLSRDTVQKTNFLDYYHPVKDVGQVLRNEDFFESGVDPDGVLYLTERGDQVYFAMIDENGKRNLYKMDKLLDGWSDSEALNELNTNEDDMYPFLLIDGQTLFFSSNREGGLGGFDIYKSSYDSETKTFTSPLNMGIPFNSPKDDYLFVSDEFNNKAWFASNRELTDSLIIVYSIKWDKSVVKNLVTDMNVVKDLANLPLAAEAGKQGNGRNGSGSNQQAAKSSTFRYMVADTLIYTDMSHFNSDEARQYFKESQKLQAQKDSLSNLMRGQRERYARTNNDTERAMLVNDILSLEKDVYGLDAKIEKAQNNARYTEMTRIKELIRQGRYIAPSQVKYKKEEEIKLNEVFIPSEYTYYTDDEFDKELERLSQMYDQLFESDEIKELKRADSLYVWGNILTLESSKLLEEAADQPATKVPIVSSPFKKDEEAEEEISPAESMISKSKELKKTALELYHLSLNNKHEVYGNKINELVKSNPTADFTFLEEPQIDANGYFRKASELLNPLLGYDMETFERAGALKRSGVHQQEEALFTYLDYAEGKLNDVSDVVAPVAGKAQKTYQELQGSTEEVIEKTKLQSEVKQEYEYRIQIGVFRNEPNAEALEKIPQTSKVAIPDKGLTKYFAGSYSTYTEATKDLDKVRSAGFTGAFIVVFKDGKQINLTDELRN